MQSRQYLWGNTPRLPGCNSGPRKQLGQAGKLLPYMFHFDMSVLNRSRLSRTWAVPMDTHIARLDRSSLMRNRFARRQFGREDSTVDFDTSFRNRTVPQRSTLYHNKGMDRSNWCHNTLSLHRST